MGYRGTGILKEHDRKGNFLRVVFSSWFGVFVPGAFTLCLTEDVFIKKTDPFLHPCHPYSIVLALRLFFIIIRYPYLTDFARSRKSGTHPVHNPMLNRQFVQFTYLAALWHFT